jgi:hypothetical protein
MKSSNRAIIMNSKLIKKNKEEKQNLKKQKQKKD